MKKGEKYCYHSTVDGHVICPHSGDERCPHTCLPGCDPKSAAHLDVLDFHLRCGAAMGIAGAEERSTRESRI